MHRNFALKPAAACHTRILTIFVSKFWALRTNTEAGFDGILVGQDPPVLQDRPHGPQDTQSLTNEADLSHC